MYEKLKKFLLFEMKMSHIYQPVMIKTLLQKNGSADKSCIAEQILMYDPSQIEYQHQIKYYEHVVKNMVGKVLTDNRKITKKSGLEYILEDFGSLSKNEINKLKIICDQKIIEYMAKRGDKIWEHREKLSRI